MFWSRNDTRTVKCVSKETYRPNLTYHGVERGDADAAFACHQKGNGGRVVLNCSGGKKVSLSMFDFVAVEIY